jgi:putative endonuclease
MMSVVLYMLRCADDTYYVGSTRKSLEARLADHAEGRYESYTAGRRPVTLVFHHRFEHLAEASAAERRLKSWRRDQKEALSRCNPKLVHALIKRKKK